MAEADAEAEKAAAWRKSSRLVFESTTSEMLVTCLDLASLLFQLSCCLLGGYQCLLSLRNL